MLKKKPYHKPKVIVRLCPNCKTIQRCGKPCSICKCPIICEEDKEDED